MSSISYRDGTFDLFRVGGDERLLKNGWAFVFSSGLPCAYATRSLAAVRWAMAQGSEYVMKPSAIEAFATHVSDEQWATDREAERVAKNKADQERLAAWYVEREKLVASARAKLTEAEFDAVLEEGRDQ